jgi:hypothetical protein
MNNERIYSTPLGKVTLDEFESELVKLAEIYPGNMSYTRFYNNEVGDALELEKQLRGRGCLDVFTNVVQKPWDSETIEEATLYFHLYGAEEEVESA